jgi:hypothetical protein
MTPAPRTPETQQLASTGGTTSFLSQHIAGVPDADGYEKLQARQRLSRSQRDAQTAGSPFGTVALEKSPPGRS